VDGILYAIGGQGSSGRLATVEAYDPATGTWTTKGPMTTARSLAVGGFASGILYTVGGIVGSGTTTASVEAYTP
jgi:RecA/RadA recombinase